MGMMPCVSAGMASVGAVCRKPLLLLLPGVHFVIHVSFVGAVLRVSARARMAGVVMPARRIRIVQAIISIPRVPAAFLLRRWMLVFMIHIDFS